MDKLVQNQFSLSLIFKTTNLKVFLSFGSFFDFARYNIFWTLKVYSLR